jgi:hypothetical protein
MINDTTAIKEAAASADIAGRNEDCPAGFALDLVHRLPGRLRLRAVALKGNVQAIARRRRQLAKITGVILVEANPSTGSFLLKYDPAVLPSANVAEILASYGIRVRTPDGAASDVRLSEELLTALKRSMLEALAERLMLVIIGAAA